MSKLIIFGGKELPFFTSWGPEANSIIMIVTAIVLLLLVPFCLPRKADEDQFCMTRNWIMET
jgi:hypothetical protein